MIMKSNIEYDYDKTIKTLIELGKHKGFIVEDDIKKLIPRDILNIASDSIIATLTNQGIDIITSE